MKSVRELGWRQLLAGTVAACAAVLGSLDALFGTGAIAEVVLIVLLLLVLLVVLVVIHRSSRNALERQREFSICLRHFSDIDAGLRHMVKRIEAANADHKIVSGALEEEIGRIAGELQQIGRATKSADKHLRDKLDAGLSMLAERHQWLIKVSDRLSSNLDAGLSMLGERHQGLVEVSDRLSSKLDTETSTLRRDTQALQTEALRIGDRIQKLTNSLRWRNAQVVVEMQSLFALFGALQVRTLLPNNTTWSMAPSAIATFLTTLEEVEDPLILECGSGNTTLFVAHALRVRGGGRLVALEHLPEWGDRIRFALEREGLLQYAEVRHAPLCEIDLPIVAEPDNEELRTFSWYDPGTFADLAAIDAVLVDGPPGDTGKWARYPALPLVLEQLTENAIVLLDDAHRAEEREILALWGELVRQHDCRIETLVKLREASLFRIQGRGVVAASASS